MIYFITITMLLLSLFTFAESAIVAYISLQRREQLKRDKAVSLAMWLFTFILILVAIFSFILFIVMVTAD